jgi:hypothetical protein
MLMLRDNSDQKENRNKTGESVVASIFGLKGDSWLRHANPASVWTRYFILLLLSVSIWSRVWIGWYCMIPLVILLFWTKVNPLFFSVPKNINSWSSQCVVGEMMFSRRRVVPIKQHHMQVVKILYIIQFLGVMLVAWGLYFLILWPTIEGLILVYTGKTWFLDRMVWVYMEMIEEPEYKSILKQFVD